MSSSSEAPEIEKQKDFSVSTLVKRDLTLPLESAPKVENGNVLEEEDDLVAYLNYLFHFMSIHLLYILI